MLKMGALPPVPAAPPPGYLRHKGGAGVRVSWWRDPECRADQWRVDQSPDGPEADAACEPCGEQEEAVCPSVSRHAEECHWDRQIGPIEHRKIRPRQCGCQSVTCRHCGKEAAGKYQTFGQGDPCHHPADPTEGQPNTPLQKPQRPAQERVVPEPEDHRRARSRMHPADARPIDREREFDHKSQAEDHCQKAPEAWLSGVPLATVPPAPEAQRCRDQTDQRILQPIERAARPGPGRKCGEKRGEGAGNKDCPSPEGAKGGGLLQRGRAAVQCQLSIASNSSIMPSITDNPLSQNAGSLASRPKGASRSLWCLDPPALSMSKYFS